MAGQRKVVRRRSPAHSVTFTPELRAQVKLYASVHNLPFGAAVRTLVTEQLRELREVDRLRRAREWQIAQGWAEARAIAEGQVDEVAWDEIEKIRRKAVVRARGGERRRTAR